MLNRCSQAFKYQMLTYKPVCAERYFCTLTLTDAHSYSLSGRSGQMRDPGGAPIDKSVKHLRNTGLRGAKTNHRGNASVYTKQERGEYCRASISSRSESKPQFFYSDDLFSEPALV